MSYIFGAQLPGELPERARALGKHANSLTSHSTHARAQQCMAETTSLLQHEN